MSVEMCYVNIALECMEIAVTLILIICSINEVKVMNKQTKIIISMFATNILVILSDMITWIFDDNNKFETFLYIDNFFVYSLGYVLTALFAMYLADYISQKAKFPKWILYSILALCAISVALVGVSMFNKMYFEYIDGIYVRGNMFWMSQMFPVIILVVCVASMLKYRKHFEIRDIVSFSLYGVLPAVCILIQVFTYGITLLYAGTTLALLILYTTIHSEQARRLQQKENELTQANISIMLSQIQPHFLYNALTSISVLCEKDPPKAKTATIEFSHYLRGNLDSIGQSKPIKFETELNHIKHYLSLEKMRFGDELNIVYDIQTTDFCVPTLAIQPLVENAVKYGVGKKEGGGTVTLATRETKTDYVIVVTDDGIGYDPAVKKQDGRSHTGIKNVKNRVVAMCGGNVTVESQLGKGTKAKITIPKDVEVKENA